ncbi:LOW QUALITY PROTEIN: Hypothetical protein PHPALM_16914 [Phytophthora palmivora]|uniref:DDE-1 domain-containing protein n=1 Tax=Phytophthora palmivora TaxID=4796 RepID=A0A2P4XNI9_9STRA|nr:LOW QUALITY PROTEIN: Hypothetical protein PHPALM_16914 [Phytophthora palmivora]
MHARGWDFYTSEVLLQELDGPAVMLADNFDCHVGQQLVMAEKANSVMFPLPPNRTSTSQPLDIGVMGPLKSALRSTWIQKRPCPKMANEKRMDIIKRAIFAWRSIYEETVLSSLKKANSREFEAVETV